MTYIMNYATYLSSLIIEICDLIDIDGFNEDHIMGLRRLYLIMKGSIN